MAALANGLQTIELGSINWRLIFNSNMQILDLSVFQVVLESELPTSNFINGRIFLTSDSNNIYFDNGSGIKNITGNRTVVGLEADKTTGSVDTEFYFATDTGALYYNDNGTFINAGGGIKNGLDADKLTETIDEQIYYATDTQTLYYNSAGTMIDINKQIKVGLDADKLTKTIDGQFYFATDTGSFYYNSNNTMVEVGGGGGSSFDPLSVNSNIVPDTTNSRLLGSNSKQWSITYTGNVFSNAALYINSPNSFLNLMAKNGVNISDNYSNVASFSYSAGNKYYSNASRPHTFYKGTSTLVCRMDTGQFGIQFWNFIAPGTDNTYDLGASSFRWKDIYASNAVIQTSDKNMKKDILDLSDELVEKIMDRLRPVSFKMLEGKRTHIGLIAQEIEDIHAELGIDIAWLIKSPKTKEMILNKGKKNEEINKEIIPNEFVYGLRYEEFTSLNMKYSQILNKKLENLTKRIIALESK